MEMSKSKTTQDEVLPAAGNTPAARASASGNVPAADAEKETPTTEVPETEDAAEVATMSKDVVIVVCGTPEALPLLTKAWEQKAAPAVILPREVGSTPFAELITGLLAEDVIPDTFIFVPANCFPTHRVNLADLSAYRIRCTLIQTNKWTKTNNTRLPVLLEASMVLKTLELLDNNDTFTAEEFFEKYNSIAHSGELAEEVGMSFGNTVAFADTPNPCMAKVAEALLRKKFICTTAAGFTPIKERLALLYE